MSEIFGRLGGPRDDDDLADQQHAGPMVVSPNAGRWLRRHLAGGVVALTTRVADLYRASTLTGSMVASLDPLQMLISLEADTQMAGWIDESRFFAVSILSYQQQVLADRFAGLAPLASSRFHGIEHFIASTGAPVLSDSIGWADCSVVQQFGTGDHICFLGEVIAAGLGAGHSEDPLVYYLSRYGRLR